jgi:hypothetical protein
MQREQDEMTGRGKKDDRLYTLYAVVHELNDREFRKRTARKRI